MKFPGNSTPLGFLRRNNFLEKSGSQLLVLLSLSNISDRTYQPRLPRYRRVGQVLEIEVTVALIGSPNSTLHIKGAFVRSVLLNRSGDSA